LNSEAGVVAITPGVARCVPWHRRNHGPRRIVGVSAIADEPERDPAGDEGSKVPPGKALSVWNACFVASSSGILRPICKEDWKTGGS
jgi:hypothetical protein